MMRMLKNKFFICVLCIALALSIFLTVFSAMGVTGVFKNAVGVMLSPFERLATFMKESLEGYGLYFQDMDDLIKENQALRDELEQLRIKLNEYKLSKDENDRLRKYIGLRESYEDMTLVEGLIIGGSGENYTSLVKINVGSSSGIEVGMPVVVPSGVVGSVCEVGYNWANVRLICEAASGVGGYISRSGEIGIIRGDVEFKDTGVCNLEYLRQDADIQIGDLIYTSGKGGVYPGGLLVGKVASVRMDDRTRTKVATVSCAVDFNSLRYVMVITDISARVEAEDD